MIPVDDWIPAIAQAMADAQEKDDDGTALLATLRRVVVLIQRDSIATCITICEEVGDSERTAAYLAANFRAILPPISR